MSGIDEQFKSASRSLSRLLKRTTDAVSERWEELTAIQDRRREMRQLARERQQLLVEMGTKVYSLHRRGKVQNTDLLTDCEQIDTIADDVERLEREIEELKRQQAGMQPPEADVSDESPVVGEEDIDTAAAEAEETEAEDAEAEDAESDEGPTMIPVETSDEDEGAEAETSEEPYQAPDDAEDADTGADEDSTGLPTGPRQPYAAPDDAEDMDADEK